MSLYIPPETQAKLNGHHPEGTRHKAAMEIALPLIGNGMAPQAVFAQLRATFDPDVTDRELENVVRWAESKHPTPSGYGHQPTNGQPFTRNSTPRREPAKPKPPEEHCRWWLTGAELDSDTLKRTSPVRIPDSQADSLCLFIEALYGSEDSLNVVTLFSVDEKHGKANPSGVGRTVSRDKWLAYFREKGIPQSEAGAWLRMNPVSAEGISDQNVTAFRYLLVESDTLPLPVQQALYSRLPLPVVAIFSSGGKSVHAWVRMDSPNLEAFKETATRILKTLAPFGIDESNKNASRLSRLPGAVRKIGSAGDGVQRLLWLNPSAMALDVAGLSLLDEALKLPALEEKPMSTLFNDSMNRYDELYSNRGKNGIQTGLTSFDIKSGGLKPGQMTVIAAVTNGGKSSIAMNFINVALTAGTGVALFSMEMDRQEIFDMLVAMNCEVSRNCFNTGHFADGDHARIKEWGPWFRSLRLWIEDSATMTVSAIRARTLQLVREKQIGLAVVDYIQFISAEDSREPREQQMAGISRALRALAKEARIPVLVLSQLNDDGKLRESRVIGHDAHVVVNVEGIDSKDSVPKFKVIKGRSIPKGTHPFVFRAEFCQMKNPEKIQESDVPSSEPAQTSFRQYPDN